MLIEFLWSPEPIIFVQQLFGESWNLFFQTLSELGTATAVTVAFALAFWISGRRFAWCLVGAVLLVTLINVLIWSIFYVPRPHDPQIIVHEKLALSSFPSGHTGTATLLWGTLSAFNRIPAAVTACIVLGVMLSRLYLGVHYLGDVLSGLALGLILVVVYQRLWPVLVRCFSGRTFRFFLVLSLSAPIGVFPFTSFFPEGWEVFGAAVGAGIGIPLEYWYVRYSPAKVPKRKQVLKVIIGLGVLVMLVLSFRFIISNELARNTITFCLAALWITFLAPALFTRMGLSKTLSSQSPPF